jgi:thiol-disulfide isomerase/thioredoxin
MKAFIPEIIVTFSALTLLLSGCDVREPRQKAEQPAQAVVAPETPLFYPGQTIDEVQKLLGNPNGVITTSNQTVLLYGKESLRFTEGRWINYQPDIQKQIADGKKTVAQPAVAKKPAQKAAAQAQPTASVSPAAAGPSSQYSGLVSPGQITVVDFYATWCGPCKQIAPILDRLVGQQSGVVLRKVDIGNWDSGVAKKYNITSVPNIRVFDKKGRMVGSPTSDPNQVARYIEQAKRS